MTTPRRALSDGVVLCFYGDDFTGSSSAMEILTFAGLPTVMFLEAPDARRMARFAHARCIGVAGVARSRSPDWMDRTMPGVYRALRTLGPRITHYKTCSTFDSAAHVGSIGRAIELADDVFDKEWRPLLVAAPNFGRWQAFGNLFAAVDGVSYRLDRHPVMARHPVTPMNEADVRLHLARQTTKKVGLVDFVAMKERRADRALANAVDNGAEIVALDAVDADTLVEAGRLIWEATGERAFVVGSQGVEYSLVAYWRSLGLLPPPSTPPRAAAAHRVVCASGSCSPITAAQIAHARDSGFALLRLDPTAAVEDARWNAAVEDAIERALAAIDGGRDPLVFTAIGPDDPSIGALGAAIRSRGVASVDVNDRIGSGLGRVVDQVMSRGRLSRGVIAGGDTSGHAVAEMGSYALTAIASIATGAPLCRTFSDEPKRDGREIALKGGQVGEQDFFSAVRAGGPIA